MISVFVVESLNTRKRKVETGLMLTFPFLFVRLQNPSLDNDSFLQCLSQRTINCRITTPGLAAFMKIS